jgi:hypothetical protein
MGYCTNFSCTVKGKLENKEKVAELEKAKKDAEKLTGKLREIALAGIEKELKIEKSINVKSVITSVVGYNPLEDETKWYEHEEHMRKISLQYPDVIFELRGEGEESGDIWVKYFVNGKMQLCAAKIVFEEFDEKKLK